MEILAGFRSALADWAKRAFPQDADEHEDSPAGNDDVHPADLERKSIHDVTLEPWGIAHWSCHTHF